MSTGIFSAPSIDRIVSDQLGTLPAGHTNAVVGTVDDHGAQVEARFTLGPDERWVFQGAYRYDWASGDETGTGKVIVSW